MSSLGEKKKTSLAERQEKCLNFPCTSADHMIYTHYPLRRVRLSGPSEATKERIWPAHSTEISFASKGEQLCSGGSMGFSTRVQAMAAGVCWKTLILTNCSVLFGSLPTRPVFVTLVIKGAKTMMVHYEPLPKRNTYTLWLFGEMALVLPWGMSSLWLAWQLNEPSFPCIPSIPKNETSLYNPGGRKD